MRCTDGGCPKRWGIPADNVSLGTSSCLALTRKTVIYFNSKKEADLPCRYFWQG